MRTTREYQTDTASAPDEQRVTESRMMAVRSPWSPVQLVTLIVGLVVLVVGAIALARTGLNVGNAPHTRSHVAGLTFTSLSAVVVLGAGVLLVVSAASAAAARAASWFFGLLGVAFGLVVALSPVTFTKWWRFDAAEGVLLIVGGVILLIAAALSPVFVQRDAVQVERRSSSAQTPSDWNHA